MKQRCEPARISGLAVALEPAYITSWQPGSYSSQDLTVEESAVPSFGASPAGPEVHEDKFQQSPSKVEHSPQATGMDTDVGSVLRVAANYRMQSPSEWPQGQSMAYPSPVHRGSHDVNRNMKTRSLFPQGTRRQKRHQNRRCDLLIATQLSRLQDEDPRKLLIVRKINRLGFNSADILSQHYGRYGVVSNVLLSNKHEKDADAVFRTRLRPSGIGFVLFESVESATQALAAGATQTVAGVEIVVRAFEKRRLSEDNMPEDLSSTKDADESDEEDVGSCASKSVAEALLPRGLLNICDENENESGN